MIKQKRVSAIIVAAGASRRMGFDKLFYKIDSKEVLLRSFEAFSQNEYIDEIIVVAGDNLPMVKELLQGRLKLSAIVRGGSVRSESVQSGLKKAQGELVAIHDGARPFVSQEIINETINAALIYGAAAPGIAVKDTIKHVENGMVINTPIRKDLVAVQTPQVFDKALYISCLEQLGTKAVTDDCMVVENAGKLVSITQGDYANIKITTTEDLPSGKIREEKPMRMGHGYDVHKFSEKRRLILGGVDVPNDRGLLGHSDADVLVHAVIDALLGAAALGDIGKHFPDTDAKYKGANSIELLQDVGCILAENGYKVCNIDSTIICQKPKLAPFIAAMRVNIANALNLQVDQINVKATTEEGLGFTGAMEGIAAHAVAVISML